MCPLQELRIIFVDETPQCGEEAKQNESYLQTSMAFAMNGLKLRWNKWADLKKIIKLVPLATQNNNTKELE